MLIGGDDTSNDVITLALVYQCLCTFALVSVHCRKSDSSVNRKPQGNWRWKYSNSRDIVASSRTSFSRPAARAPWKAYSEPSEIVSISQHNDWADLATEQECQLTTARANQTTGLTNGKAANWAPGVEFSPYRTLSRRQMTFRFCC